MSNQASATAAKTCDDARCGHWLVMGPPVGAPGVRADLFASIGRGLPEDTVLVDRQGAPQGVHAPPGCWLIHVPHDWVAVDEDDEDDDG